MELLEKLRTFLDEFEPTFLGSGSTLEKLTNNEIISKSLNKNLDSLIEIFGGAKIYKMNYSDYEFVFLLYTKTTYLLNHALVLEIDRINLSMELFDPLGIQDDEYYEPLYSVLKNISPGYKIKKISETCTVFGPQYYGQKYSKSKCPNKAFGYCGIYVIFYMFLRSKYPEFTKKEIIDAMINLSVTEDYYIERFITFMQL